MNLTAPKLRPRLFDARWKGRLGRFMFALATFAQLVGASAGVLEHWRANSKIGTHIEQSGSQQAHYQHNEATCSACAIGHMAAHAPRRAEASFLWEDSSAASFRVVERAALHEQRTQASPRAPPTGSRIS